MATGTLVEVVMPQMGVSVSEGTVTRWLRSVGDTVAADESLLEVSTDKVDTEVPAPGGGVLREILVPEGETVAVGTVLARIGPADEPEAADQASAAAPQPSAGVATDAAPPPPESQPAEPTPPLSSPEPPPSEPPAPEYTGPEPAAGDGAAAPEAGGREEGAHTFVSPVVARIAAEHGVDPTTIEGTGRAGRVRKRDVLAYVEAAARADRPPPEPAPSETSQPEPPPPAAAPAAPAVPTLVAAAPTVAPEPATDSSPAPTAASTEPGAVALPEPSRAPAPVQREQAEEDELGPGESLEPLSIIRRGIAEHMRRSLDTAAHVTSAIEVDMSKVVAIRERIKGDFTSDYGVNPTYLAFIARATVETLRDWPWINAELRDDGILTRRYVNLGFAVALESGKGLIVPVLRNAEGLNLLGMARGIADLAERARTRKLLPDDVQGGTFTITNPGVYGTLLGTPIINQPQSAILGTYAIVKRAWVISDDGGQDAIAIRSIANLTLTYDHRLVDGAYGAQFLRDLADRLQTWNQSDY